MSDYGTAALVVAIFAIVLIIILAVVVFFNGGLIGRFTNRYIIQNGTNANEALITGGNNLYLGASELTTDITLTVTPNNTDATGTTFAVKNNSGTRNIIVRPGDTLTGTQTTVGPGAFAQFVFTSPTQYTRLS